MTSRSKRHPQRHASRALRRHEHRQLRHRGAGWIVALFLLLAGLSVPIGLDRTRDADAARLPGDTGAIALPPSGLQALSAGHRERLPSRAGPFTEFEITHLWPTNVVPNGMTVQDLYRSLTGYFDPAHVLVWVLPLLVLALSYDLLSRDREQGTLALVLSAPVTAGEVVAAKVLARVPWTVAPALIAYTAACAAGNGAMAPRTWTLALAGAVLVAAYTLLWLAMSVWVNTRGWSSPTNALTVGVSWLMLVVVLPPSIDALIREAHVRPSTAEAAVREGHWRRDEAYGNALHEVFYERLLRELPGLGPARPVNADPVRARNYGEDGGRALAFYAYAYRDLAGAATALAERFSARQQLLDAMRYVSPAAVLKESLDEVAGTHERRYRAFERQVRAYFDGIREREWDREFKVQSHGAVAAVQQQVRTALERELGAIERPAFRFAEDSTGVVGRRFIGALAALAIPVWLCAHASRRALRRRVHAL